MMKKAFVLAASLLIFLPVYAGAVSQPLQTGQTLCYDQVGASIPCSASGQDGDSKAGVAWTNPRFTDNGDGSMTDSLTGLVWTRDAGLSGAVTWQGALDYVKTQNMITYLGHSDWRLPNVNEMRSLINAGAANPGAWLASSGFSNLPAPGLPFWTSTGSHLATSDAFVVHQDTGLVDTLNKGNSGSAWAVRTWSQPGLVQLPQTGQTACYNTSGNQISCVGTGQDGELRSGSSWPGTRFTDNGDETISDNLTGLMWAKDANLMMGRNPSFDTDGVGGDGAVTWQHALDYVAGLNAPPAYLGFSDWRIPNVNELRSLIHGGQADSSAWLATWGFVNVPGGGQFPWASSSFANAPQDSLAVYLGSGSVQNIAKANKGFVWPVRGGLYGDPALTFSPLSQDFGTVTMGGASGAREFTISNTSTKNQKLAISSITITGTDQAMFTVAAGGTNPCASLTPALDPGASCTVLTTFVPTLAGSKIANLEIASNASSVPQKATLTGTSIDGTPPTGSVVINGGASYTTSPTVTLTLAATDNSGTVSEMRFGNSTTKWSAWETYGTSKSWVLATGDGEKFVYVQFRDPNKNESLIYFTTIILDTTPPSGISITGVPLSGYVNSGTLVLTVSGTDLAEYSYALTPAVPSGATLTPAQNTYVAAKNQIVLTNLPEGSYAISVTGRDLAGNVQTTLATASWVVDRTVPTLTINTAAILSPTNVSSQTITGNVEAGISSVAVNVNPGNVNAFATVSGSSWSYPATFATDGLYTIKITATDPAGNTKTAVATVTYDTTPPTAVVSGTPAPASTTNSPTVTLMVDGSDVVSYQYKLDSGSFLGEVAVNTPIIIPNLTIPSLTNGDHTISVIGRDLAGNLQDATKATKYSWKIATTPPKLTLNAVTTPTGTVTQKITGTVDAGSSVTVAVNGGAAVTANVTGSAWDYTITPLVVGSNSFVITARDTAGNVTTTSGAIVYDNSAPGSVTITGVPSNPTRSKSAIMSVSGTGIVSYKYSLDGKAYSAETTVDIFIKLGTAAPAPSTPLTEGAHSLAVIGKDLAGNWQATATTVSWTVQSVAPTAVINGTLADGDTTNVTSIALNVSGTNVVAYKWSLDGAPYSSEVLLQGIPADKINIALSATPLRREKHTVFVIARDNANNWQITPTAFSWTFKNTIPLITVNTPPVPTKSTTISGTVEAGADVYVNGTKLAASGITTTPDPEVNNWTATVTGLVNGSGNNVTVTATDAAGNTDSKVIAITYDNVQPTYVLQNGPAQGSTTTSNTAVYNIAASENIASYTYKIDTASTVTVYLSTPSANPTVPIALNGLSTGSHSLTVTVQDVAGNNSAAVSPRTWTIVSDPLTLNITSPVSPTNVANQVVSGTVSASATSVACATSTAATCSLATGAPNWSYTINGLQAGPNIITITASDGTNTTSNSVNIFYKTTGPTAVVNNVPSTGYTKADSLNLTVGGVDVVRYSYTMSVSPSDPGIVVTPAQSTSTLVATPISFTTLPVGTYTISLSVTGIDAAGNSGTPKNVSFVVKKFATGTALLLTLDLVTTPTNATSQTLSGTVEHGAIITIFISPAATLGKITSTPTANPNVDTWQCDITGLKPNTDTAITVLASDLASNSSMQTALIKQVSTLPVASVTGQTPALKTIVDGSVVNETGANFTVAQPGNLVAYRYSLDNGTTFVPPSGWTAIGSGSIISLSSLAEGVHSIWVYVQDNAGNEQQTPTIISWTVRTTPPTALLTQLFSSPTNTKIAQFRVDGNDVVAYKYDLDSAGFGSSEYPVNQTLKIDLTSSPLLNGSHTLTVIGRDVAGNWQASPVGGGSANWVVDTIPPDLTVDSPPPPTNTLPVTIGGTVGDTAPGTIVSVSVTNTTNSTTGSGNPSGGTWGYTFNALVPGTNNISITATDNSGNMTTKSVSLIYLTTLPTATISGVPPNLTNQTSANLIIGGANVTAYQYRLEVNDGTSTTVLTDWTTETQVASKIALTGLGNVSGNLMYTLYVKGKDLAGNWQTTATVASWMVDLIPPAMIMNKVITPTNVTTQILSGTVEPGATVSVSADTTASKGNATVVGANWSYTITGLAAGINNITVTAHDSAGNTTTTVAGIEYRNSPPTATLSGAPPGITNSTSATMTVGGKDVVAYKYSLDSDPYSTEIPVGTPILLTDLGNGSHTVSVIARDQSQDAAGQFTNWQTSATTVSWTVDITSPVASLTGVPSAQTKDTTATITVGGAGVVGYRYSLDGGLYTSEVSVTAPLALVGLGTGSHTLLVLGKSSIGNWQTVPTRASWIIDQSPPSLTLNTVTTPTVFSNQRISGTTEANATVTVTVDTAAKGGNATVSGTSWSFVVNGLVAGPNNITVTASDTAGNSSTVSTSIVFYIPPVTTITGTPASPTNSTTATLAIGGTGVAAYKYSLDGEAYSAETLVATPISLTSLREGTHVVTVLGKDNAGNWQITPSSATWTVDLTPPIATVTDAPAALTAVNSAKITVGGSDVISYQYKLDGGLYQGETPVAQTIDLTALADGSHTLTVIGRDLAGNWQATPTTVTWVIDTVKPVTTVSPLGGNFTNPITITLAASETAAIYYTTDGSTPTTSSLVYSGPLTIAVTTQLKFFARDSAGNSEAVRTEQYNFIHNGDLNGDGKVDITDVVLALQVVVDLRKSTSDEVLRADVAPLKEGKPNPDGKIDVGDLVVILEKIVDLVNW